MDLKLDDAQATELRATLDAVLSDLRMEIVETDNPAYRRDLKRRADILRAVRDHLGA
jgi:hypothetical protein